MSPVLDKKQKKLSQLEKWRKEQFEEMEFTNLEAEQLATFKEDKGKYAADITTVRKMLRDGCPRHLVLRIII